LKISTIATLLMADQHGTVRARGDADMFTFSAATIAPMFHLRPTIVPKDSVVLAGPIGVVACQQALATGPICDRVCHQGSATRDGARTADLARVSDWLCRLSGDLVSRSESSGNLAAPALVRAVRRGWWR
jgi:hypothetical protein